LVFTTDGRWFVIMTVLVGVGAVNTGNNLLYLLLGMMLGLILVSGVLSERVLKGVTVKRLPSGDLFAALPMRISYEVRNDKRFFSSFSINVDEHESRETRGTRRVTLGLPFERPRRRKAREAEDDPGPPSALATRIPPKKAVVITGEYVFPQRGLYRYVGIDLGTRFPFGFFQKIRPIREPVEVLVYPEIRHDIGGKTFDDMLFGEVHRASEGRGGDFFGLREFRAGDDRRDVHWKVSARRNQLVRRLYERQDNEAIALYLYNWAPTGQGAEADARHLRDVERTIVHIASTCAWLAREGHRFSVHTLAEHVPEGAGAGQLQTVLRHLALLEIQHGEPPALIPTRMAQRILFAPTHTPPEVRVAFETILGEVPTRAAA